MVGKALRRLIPVLVVLLIAAGFYWWARSRRPPPEYSMAYVVDTNAILWNSNAQVRQPVDHAPLRRSRRHLQRAGERADVRGDAGVTRLDRRISPHGRGLVAASRDAADSRERMPVQARGHTRTISNVRLTAGRDGARIFQFGRNEPVVVLERATGAVPDRRIDAETRLPQRRICRRREDWLLILRTPQPPRPERRPQPRAGVRRLRRRIRRIRPFLPFPLRAGCWPVSSISILLRPSRIISAPRTCASWRGQVVNMA